MACTSSEERERPMPTFPVVMEEAHSMGKVTAAVAPGSSEGMTCSLSRPFTVILSSEGIFTFTLLQVFCPLFRTVTVRSNLSPSRRFCLLTV